jgi:HPt (histidine-containing phosphotransfer) domain-containing protein
MPVMGGFEATAAIRALEKESGSSMPIIGVTAHAMKGDRERCLAVGMDAYVSKPLRPQEVFAAIDELVGRARDAAPSAQPVVDEAVLERLGGDLKLLREIAIVFEKTAPAYLAQIRTALNARDAGSLEGAAHTLQGAASNFGASELVELGQRLEQMGRSGELDQAATLVGPLEGALADLVLRLRAITFAAPADQTPEKVAS